MGADATRSRLPARGRRGRSTLKALVSVHDVMPSTLSRVTGLIEALSRAEAPPATLLVIPGREWTEPDLRWLRARVEEGHRLAGHGWTHEAVVPRNLGHRLHAALLSRNRAEHLSLERVEVRRIVLRCHAWFEESRLPAPDLYVPPAWGLGALTDGDLRNLPFRWYEILRGFIDARTGRRRALPLVGFEADTRGRKGALRATNFLNLALAGRWRRPVRIAIHPNDADLLLASDLAAVLRRPWEWVDEAEAAGIP